MLDGVEDRLADSGNVYLIAPAGYGKTQLIAKAVAKKAFGRQLLLTHTHAGVRSLKERLKQLRVNSDKYTVDTIASWALRLSASYPQLSGIKTTKPKANEWGDVYLAAINALKGKNIQRVIRESFAGLYVDEYQDCTKTQHELILELSKLLPTRILGDPLQGIFEFEEATVDWEKDVLPYFTEITGLKEPWRWRKVNPELGSWLEGVRSALIAGEEIDLRKAPGSSVRWLSNSSYGVARKASFDANSKRGSLVVVHKWASQAHGLARQLKGVFTSMEEVECKDLMVWSRKLDSLAGSKRALAVVSGAEMCWTGISQNLKTIKKAITNGKIPKTKKHMDIFYALSAVVEKPDDLKALVEALRSCKSAGDVLYRIELWEEMLYTLETFSRGKFESLEDAAWYVRNKSRRVGKSLHPRMMSRTLLIKGLEFDHVIIANADTLEDAKNLYVALTRAKMTLTIISQSPVLKRKPGLISVL